MTTTYELAINFGPRYSGIFRRYEVPDMEGYDNPGVETHLSLRCPRCESAAVVESYPCDDMHEWSHFVHHAYTEIDDPEDYYETQEEAVDAAKMWYVTHTCDPLAQFGPEAEVAPRYDLATASR